MLEENQLQAENNHGLEQNDSSSFSAPFRHKGYRKALDALREALNKENSVILKGVEGTGKTTLVSELIGEYQNKGVPVVSFTTVINKTSQFYAKLADSLSVPKQKKDLIRALRNTKDAGQYCLVVIDQEAIHSSPDVAEALKQLCQTSETTAGAIKLVIIRKDYLVIHTEGTPEADFHNWIKTEVTLDPLHTDDIEGYIYYLSTVKGIQPTPYEIGTDFMMIEQTEGRISRLKALLLPLIHKDVITMRDFNNTERNMKPLHSNHSVTIAVAFAFILALGVGINHFIFSEKPSSIATPSKEQTQALPPVFAEAPTSAPEPVATKEITPPSRTTVTSLDLSAQALDDSDPSLLPVLESSNTPDNTEIAKQETASIIPISAPSAEEKTLTPNTAIEIDSADSIDSAEKPQIATQDLTELPQDQFQTEVKIKLLLLEQELTEAVVENNRLKLALLEAKAEQQQKQLVNEAPTPSAVEEAIETPDEVPTPKSKLIVESLPKGDAALPIAGTANDTDTDTDTDTIEENSKGAPPETRSDDIAVVAPQIETAKPNQATDAAIAVVEHWQEAWQAQNHDAYIAYYAPGFNGAYKTHQRWLKKRFDALNKPKWIKLNRDVFTNIQQTETQVKLDFWLSYEAANGYKDSTLKRLTIEYIEGEWLIKKEQNIKVKPLL